MYGKGGVDGRGICDKGEGGMRAGEAATEADGTHPTAMHPCFEEINCENLHYLIAYTF